MANLRSRSMRFPKSRPSCCVSPATTTSTRSSTTSCCSGSSRPASPSRPTRAPRTSSSGSSSRPLLPLAPSGPQRAALSGIVLLASIAAGLGLAFLMQQMRPVFSTRDSLRQVTGLPVIGAVTAAIVEGFVPVVPAADGSRRRGAADTDGRLPAQRPSARQRSCCAAQHRGVIHVDRRTSAAESAIPAAAGRGRPKPGRPPAGGSVCGAVRVRNARSRDTRRLERRYGRDSHCTAAGRRPSRSGVAGAPDRGGIPSHQVAAAQRNRRAAGRHAGRQQRRAHHERHPRRRQDFQCAQPRAQHGPGAGSRGAARRRRRRAAGADREPRPAGKAGSHRSRGGRQARSGAGDPPDQHRATLRPCGGLPA